MTEEQPKKVESAASTSDPPPPPPPAPIEPEPEPVVHHDKPIDDSKALVLVEKPDEPAGEKPLEGSVNRDAVLERVSTEKRLSLIKAWEESEKSKAENKAHKKVAEILAWENTKKATTEAELRKIEEHLEKKKAGYAEKLKNKIATIHKEAEEKRAIIEAKKGEDLLKAEELAAKYRATGTEPKKLLGCF
ncbi:hypothetical protein TanjilG_02077 [Lupinus angustifolius]|nr:PREDICTED: remorin-like isoform X2 [Lupinus angustifolius]OIV91459.1 hypothetical protein TanjilG_02077 [Lupinus angustifolius]